MEPLVSICLPTLNSMPFLKERMETIMGQTLIDWELIICDSYSDDGSWEFFQKFGDDNRIRLYQVPREGIYAGWNECLKRTRGKYIYIATADDTCRPELLERMVGVLEERTDIELAVCNFDFIDEDSHIMDPPPMGTPRTFYGKWMEQAHQRDRRLELLVHLCMAISWTTITSVVFRRSLLDRVGYFRTDCSAYGDRFWALKSALHSHTLFVPEKLATWRHHRQQRSAHESLGTARKSLHMTAEIIRENQHLIPEEWKKDSEWHTKLLWGPRQHYLTLYRLDRNIMKTKPLTFLSGCCQAAIHEPAYLMRRLASGFSWHSRELMENEEYLWNLIDEWKVPWPPTSL